jgi:hypothetical protein
MLFEYRQPYYMQPSVNEGEFSGTDIPKHLTGICL